jgi:hypothetical protein
MHHACAFAICSKKEAANAAALVYAGSQCSRSTSAYRISINIHDMCFFRE